jgi:CDP-diacylglycerol--glycerol-3-phosphate 3-phosphatidyltransferase
MAVRVHEPGQRERVGHEARRYQRAATREPRPGSRLGGVSWPELRRHIPNALTILRFAAIPVFAWLYLEAGDGAAWGAGLFFAGAALTDQVDGYLARRWHVESRFGTIADPLADRVMIGTAVVLMWATGRLPAAAAIVVLARDLALVVGYRLLAPRGLELEVTFLGKLATWILYAALGFVLVTEEGTAWPLVLVWLGIGLALAAAAQYVIQARRVLAADDAGREPPPRREEASS